MQIFSKLTNSSAPKDTKSFTKALENLGFTKKYITSTWLPEDGLQFKHIFIYWDPNKDGKLDIRAMGLKPRETRYFTSYPEALKAVSDEVKQISTTSNNSESEEFTKLKDWETAAKSKKYTIKDTGSYRTNDREYHAYNNLGRYQGTFDESKQQGFLN